MRSVHRAIRQMMEIGSDDLTPNQGLREGEPWMAERKSK